MISHCSRIRIESGDAGTNADAQKVDRFVKHEIGIGVEDERADREPTVEFRIPISATDQFLRMVRYFLESLKVFGGPLAASAHTVVAVSRDQPIHDISQRCPWTADYSVEFQWLEAELFDRLIFHGTGLHRFAVPSQADVVVLADADVFVTGSLDEVVLEAHRSRRLLGFIGHGSPFNLPGLWFVSSRRWWNRVFDAAELPRPRLDRIHTGWGHMSVNPLHRRCPDYFNYGFLIAPRKHFEGIGKTFEHELEVVDRVAETRFKSQVAQTLANYRLRIPCGTLQINYNFPMNGRAERMRALNPDPGGADGPEDVKVFHYLGAGEVQRRHFATPASLERLLQGPRLSPYAETLRRKLQIVHARIMSSRTAFAIAPARV